MENSNEVNDGPIHTSIMPKNSNENKNGLPKEAKILKKSNDQSFVNGCNLHATILVHPKNNNFSSCIEVETNKLDNSSKLTSYCDEFAIKYLVNEMVTSIVNQTNVSSKLLTNGVDCFSLHQTNSELSREKKEANALPSTNKNTLRMSKRKRVPKKLDDEEKKEPSLPIVSIKHKIPTPETPILYNLGDLVWSYVPGHPLWPCMLTLDPLEFICSKMQGGMKPCRAYHVQFLGDSPEHGWVRESRVFPFKSPEDYDKIIKNLLSKSKKSSVKVPRMEIPARLKDDWDSGIEEILEASAFNNEDRITQYEYDFKPYMKEFKHLYSRRNKRHPVASLMSKSAGDRFDLKPHSPTACASTNEDQETTTSSADKSSNHCKRTKKFEVLDPNPSLFVSYYNKRCGPLKTERPNLTASQIRSRIEIEWDSLSPSRQKKYGKVDPLKLLDAPRKEMVPGRKGKKIIKIEQDQMESVSSEPSAESNKTDHKCSVCGVSYASQLSLSQHKRWCFLPKRKRKKVTNKVKEKSNSFDSGEKKSIDRLFKCDLCRDKFFSCKSLQIHKKFCTADKLASSVRSSSVKKSLKAIRNRSKISENTDKLSSSVLNGSPQNLSKGPFRRKEEGNEKSTDSVGQHLNELHKTEKVRHDSSSRRGKPRGRPQLGSNAKRESLCIKCEVPGSDLLHCSGGCCQSIHIQCLDGEKPGDGDSYTCHNCETRSHPCFICKLESDDGRLDLGKIKRCSVPHCGRSYHSTCLQSWKIAMMVAANEDNDGLSENHSMLNSYRCPMHTCATCASRFTDNPSSANTSGCRMFRCIRCPTAYHAGDDCIAAGSIILPGLNIICPDHFEPLKSTPYHQPVHVSWCFVCSKGGELVCCETCPAAFHPQCVSLDKAPEGEWYCRDCRHKRKPLYGDIVWVKLGSYRWWPGEITHPHDIPDNIKNLRHGVGEFVVNFFGSNDYFWLNRRRVFAYQEGDTGASTVHCSRGISSVFNKALREASHKFKELSNQRQKLHDVKSQKKRPQYKFIKTNKPIGNVQVYTADLSELPRCICKRTDSNPCGPDSECLNRMLMYECHPTLCPAGDKCQNQHFQKRDYPQSEIFKTSWGGWGLKTTASIKKGQFVNEYVGELVDSEECMRRIEQAHKNNVTNFYMLTIDKDRIIDAGPKGNLSRFMNHSCDPSCETQKWTVNGDTRVGLFARHQIQPGEELTFNYNLDCLGNDKTPCMCGAKNCSGFIGVRPKPQQLDSGRSLDHKSKKKRRRVDQRELPKHDDFCFRCRQVGTLVCCDVRGCQRAFCLSCLRLTKPPFGKWECPWHHCDFCGRRAQSFCHFCPNSFCASHVMNQLVLSVPNQYDCCTDHDPNVAEYEMEEAIAAVVASMLPADNWADKTDEIKLKETVITTAVRISEEKKDAEKIVLKAKRVRSKSKSNSSKHEKKGRAKKETDDCDDQTSTLSSLDQSHLTESDLELGPPTSSPVRRKRVKRHYFRGTKKRKKSKQRLFDSSTGSLQSSMSIGSNPPSDDADTQ